MCQCPIDYVTQVRHYFIDFAFVFIAVTLSKPFHVTFERKYFTERHFAQYRNLRVFREIKFS